MTRPGNMDAQEADWRGEWREARAEWLDEMAREVADDEPTALALDPASPMGVALAQAVARARELRG